LAALRRAGPPYERPAGELAAHTMITTGGLTKRVDRLVAAGLASRRTDTTDGRGRLIRLTTSGLDLIDAAFTAHMTNERRLVAQLTEQERAQLERILTRWLEALEPTPQAARVWAPRTTTQLIDIPRRDVQEVGLGCRGRPAGADDRRHVRPGRRRARSVGARHGSAVPVVANPGVRCRTTPSRPSALT